MVSKSKAGKNENKKIENTFMLIKPDGVKRGLIGNVIQRIENKGYKIKGLKMMKLNKKKAELLYSVHRGKSFYNQLIEFIISGPVVAIIIEGESVINVIRLLVGDTLFEKSTPGTIRGDFSISNRYNIVHCSDSKESAKREISLFFNKREVINW